jgi:hypothetical protein
MVIQGAMALETFSSTNFPLVGEKNLLASNVGLGEFFFLAIRNR